MEASGRLRLLDVNNQRASAYERYNQLLFLWPSVHVAVDYTWRQMEVSIRVDIYSLLPAWSILKPESPSYDVTKDLPVSMVVPSGSNIAGHRGPDEYCPLRTESQFAQYAWCRRRFLQFRPADSFYLADE